MNVNVRRILLYGLKGKLVGQLMLVVSAGLGSALAVYGLELLAGIARYPLGLIPFLTSIVLVIGAPDAAPSQPRALIGGHLVSGIVGFLLLWLVGPQPWVAAVGVGFAVIVMMLTDTFHPPAGINPLLIVTQSLPLTFLLLPILLGAILLSLFAWFWHFWLLRRKWPS